MVRVSLALVTAAALVARADVEPARPGAAAPASGAAAVAAPSAALPRHLVRTVIGDTGTAEPDTTTVNRYLSYDAGARSVAITLVAAANSARGGFNFNGGSGGDQTITVPLGWKIDIDFQNHDAVPHSALVIEARTPVPAMPEKPAFPRAYTSHLIDGLPAQTGHDTMGFTATRAGEFLIACGVPGHASSGMFIRFVVSADATAPSDTGTIATP